MTEKELKQLSKDALEELGRTRGIELDKRYNKAKLVKQIASMYKKEAKVETFISLKEEIIEEELAEVKAVTPQYPWGDLTIEEEAAKEFMNVEVIKKKRSLYLNGQNSGY